MKNDDVTLRLLQLSPSPSLAFASHRHLWVVPDGRRGRPGKQVNKMEKDLEFLKKFKSKQSDIEAKLEQLESVQHENENLDKAISQAQQRVSLLTGDIQKEEQDSVNFMLKSAQKDVEICAAKHLVQETSDEIVVQKSRLLKKSLIAISSM